LLKWQNFHSFLAYNSKGFSLIEVAMGLALISIIALTFLSGLFTAAKAIFIADERATSESLARSQMEYVKNQPYDDLNNPPQYILLSGIPEGYEIVISSERLDPTGDGTGNDDGVQKIAVTVSHHDESQVIVLEDYKVDR